MSKLPRTLINFVSLRASRVILHPNLANSIADASPIPCVLPQTIAFLCFNENSIKSAATDGHRLAVLFIQDVLSSANESKENQNVYIQTIFCALVDNFNQG